MAALDLGGPFLESNLASVDRHRGVPPFPETLAYVQRIRALYPVDRHPYDPKAALPLRATWLASAPTVPERLR